VGVSTDMLDRTSAEIAAVADCMLKGGTHCIKEYWYINQCVALVVGGKDPATGEKNFNINFDYTIDQATEEGMESCSSAANDCQVYYSACSLPVRLQ
jgi:hypothetical protein